MRIGIKGSECLLSERGADYAEMQVRMDTKQERKPVARIRLFGFGAKRAVLTTVTYPIDFFPG